MRRPSLGEGADGLGGSTRAAASSAIASTVLGIYYLFLFGANLLAGLVGGWLDIMPSGQFWGIHVAAILSAAVVFFLAKLVFGRLLAPQPV